MPNLILAQTQVAAGCGAIVGCSGATLVATPQAREATKDGTPGGSELSVTVTKNAAAFAGVMFQSADNEPGKTTWEAGDWVIRLNLTAGNDSLSWVGTYVCRFDNACGSLAVVGSLTGQSISFTTTGVKQMTVPGAEQSANLSDEIYIVLLFSNSNEHSNKNFGFTPDQNIDTPVVVATEYVYAGDVPLAILPDEPNALLSKSYAGDIPFSALPSYVSILDRIYAGAILMALLPDAPVAPLSKSYAGDIGLVLTPNSIYELISETEFIYAGDIPLVALPSYSSVLDRVYMGDTQMFLTPSSQRILDMVYGGDIPVVFTPSSVRILDRIYQGAVVLVLTPDSAYRLESPISEFVYAGDIPVSLLPDFSSGMEKAYGGDISFILTPGFLYSGVRAGPARGSQISREKPELLLIKKPDEISFIGKRKPVFISKK